jgi:hypothetical protein
MTYVLESDDPILKLLREAFPMTPAASDKIKRCDVFPLKEAILIHYEINPFSGNSPPPNLEQLDFIQFSEKGDPFSIVDLFRRSLYAGEVKCINEKDILELVKREEYAKWAAKKDLPLPECLTAEIKGWEPPKLGKVDDVLKIDFDALSDTVLACIGANAIAQARRRANAASKKKNKMSEIIRAFPMEKFMSDCAIAKGKEPRDNRTISGYIKHQFKEDEQD